MTLKIIFDLSEVLIAGLVGIEKQLSSIVTTPENEILNCFGGPLLENICCGVISEDTYIQEILIKERWNIQMETLKAMIRKNFHQEVEGTIPILMCLSDRFDVILLSDHAEEWVSYIKSIHPFLSVFKQTFFSYELRKTKKNPRTFLEVLDIMSFAASECLLIDDSQSNISVAASIGIRGIHFRNAQYLQKELKDRFLM